MNPEQALNVLMQAAQLAPLPAQAHMQCQQAFQVLSEAIKRVILGLQSAAQ